MARAPMQVIRTWDTADDRSNLQRRFSEATRERLQHQGKAADDRRKAQLSSLSEEIRQHLVEAAYIELALAANRDLFDEALPLDFSEQAYQRLKRHKVPFAGALKLVGAGLPKPRSDDPLYRRFRDSKKDVLTRRFDAVRAKMTDRLIELMEARKNDVPAADIAGRSTGAIDFLAFGVTAGRD